MALGLDDSENDLGPDSFFGWDNERPSRRSAVVEFEAQARPVLQGKYARFLDQSGFEQFSAFSSFPAPNRVLLKPQENDHTNNLRIDEPSKYFVHGKFVHTVYTTTPLEYALDCLLWLLSVSWQHLRNC